MPSSSASERSWNAAHTHDLALSVLHREQGELAQAETIVARAIEANPAYPVWRCMQADLFARLKRLDEAAEVFERFAVADFTDPAVDELWLFEMTLLADVCVTLRDARRARTLYELLHPYVKLNGVCVSEVSLGSNTGTTKKRAY